MFSFGIMGFPECQSKIPINDKFWEKVFPIPVICLAYSVGGPCSNKMISKKENPRNSINCFETNKAAGLCAFHALFLSIW